MRARRLQCLLALICASCVEAGTSIELPADALANVSIGSVVVIALDRAGGPPVVAVLSSLDGAVLPISSGRDADLVLFGYRCEDLQSLRLDIDGRRLEAQEGFLVRAPDIILTTPVSEGTDVTDWAETTFPELEARSEILRAGLELAVPPSVRAGATSCFRHRREELPLVIGDADDGEPTFLGASGPNTALFASIWKEGGQEGSGFVEVFNEGGVLDVQRYRSPPQTIWIDSATLDGDQVRFFTVAREPSDDVCPERLGTTMHSIALEALRAQPDDGRPLEGITSVELATQVPQEVACAGRGPRVAADQGELWVVGDQQTLSRWDGRTWTSTTFDPYDPDQEIVGCEPGGGFFDCPENRRSVASGPGGVFVADTRMGGVFPILRTEVRIGPREFERDGFQYGALAYVPSFDAVVLGLSSFVYHVRRADGRWDRLEGDAGTVSAFPRAIAPAEGGFYTGGSLQSVLRYTRTQDPWTGAKWSGLCEIGRADTQVGLLARAGDVLIVGPRKKSAFGVPVFGLHVPDECTPSARAP